MEKLIELLNEYDNLNDTIKDTIQYRFHNGYIQRGVKGIDKRANVWWYSKSFGFIKWLVENDKIDIDKVIDTAKSSVIDTYYYEEGIDDIYIPLLMVLAVEDEPIEYLLSVIK